MVVQCEPLVEEASQARSLESASTQTLPAPPPFPERSDSLQAPHTPPELMHAEGAHSPAVIHTSACHLGIARQPQGSAIDHSGLCSNFVHLFVLGRISQVAPEMFEVMALLWPEATHWPGLR